MGGGKDSKDSKLVYSTDQGDLRKQQGRVAVAAPADPAKQKVKVVLDTKGRKGKPVTLVTGIQHNPQVTSGLAPVMKFFGSRPSSPIPDRKSWKTQVVAVLAEDDLVVVAFRREMDDPRKPGAKYTTTWFDMWRIKDGKAVEHWDYGTIPPPAK